MPLELQSGHESGGKFLIAHGNAVRAYAQLEIQPVIFKPVGMTCLVLFAGTAGQMDIIF